MSTKEPIFIGIHGRKRSGKDTLAEMIVEAYAKGVFCIDSFAAPIRQMVNDHLIPFTDATKEHVDEDLGISAGRAMQLMGTEFGRQMIHPDIWLLLMTRRIREGNCEGVVIPDIRFQNEVDFIHSRGGVVLFVNRPVMFTEAEKGQRDPHHASEQGVSTSSMDYAISNNGSLQDLKEKVQEFVNTVIDPMLAHL